MPSIDNSLNMDPSEELLQVYELLEQLQIGGMGSKAAAEQLASILQEAGVAKGLRSTNVIEQLKAAADDNNNPLAREGACAAFEALATNIGQPLEPFLLPLLPLVLQLTADKIPAVRQAAESAATAVVEHITPHSVPRLLPHLYAGMTSPKWQTKEVAFKLLSAVCKNSPAYITAALPDIVPLVSDGIVDAKDEVKKVAWRAARAAFALNGNRDIEPCIQAILTCIAKPTEVPAAVTQLSGTTFVQAVEAPALAVMCPLLIKGFKEETPIKRKCAVIVNNMSKLVNNPADATLFLPRLLPRLEQVANEPVAQDTPDPECRSVAAAAHATVLRIAKEAEELETSKKYDEKSARLALDAVLRDHFPELEKDELWTQILEHVAAIASALVTTRIMSPDVWRDEAIGPYFKSFMKDAEAGALVQAYLDKCIADTADKDDEEAGDNDGEDLCNCKFSLAYGGKILLNNTRLRLKKGRRYGLCGHNGVGKSTLMKAIDAGKVDGFPPKSEVRTVYVAHDIDASLSEIPCVEFVYSDPVLQDVSHPGHGEVESMLESVGFTAEMQQKPVASLSGGWKMKLALARAMLMRPHILLLDEPTNHLDVVNVAWLENYLVNLKSVTVVTVSHDSGFLDNVCTDIVYYDNRKLKYYHGNLSEFVKFRPEAKSYYSLEAANLRFKFPQPGFLDGVTSGEKPILSMKKVNFTYPGNDKPTLQDITLKCSLSSRVAILGKNGAGKSTLIKILTGELRPSSGTVTRHPNVRVAYVAQHAFHHIEEHLDKTPNQYIRKRFQTGEDVEETEKVSRVVTKEEEEKIYNQVFMVDGQPRVLEKLVSRRKKRRSYEYEVKWKGLSSIAFNRWYTREELIERGFVKLVNKMDGEVAAEKSGADQRPLTTASIEAWLQDFGLEPEFATHSFIRGLSGGQKVKLVLAAAFWMNPHMIVLDEPTNYLDRDSLGALATALKEFQGGVVVISHHGEFTDALCTEQWRLQEGKLTIEMKAGAPAGEDTA